jgi:hypothetical protein
MSERVALALFLIGAENLPGEARRASQTLDRAERRAVVVAKRSQTSRTAPGIVDRPGEAAGGSR